MTNILIDLETLGNTPGSVVVSIGAMEIETGRTFYRAIQIDTAKAVGLTECKATMEWWHNQSPEAQAVLTDPEALPLKTVLLEFSNWFCQNGVAYAWGDGANFDCTLLECAFRACGLIPPWPYRNIRCYRTLKNIFSGVPKETYGVAHNALDDAIKNGRHLKAILTALGIFDETSPETKTD